MLADRSLYVDRSQSVLVPEGSVESAYMLVAKGQTIPAEVVKRMGLRLDGSRVVQGPEPVKEPVKAPEPAPAVVVPEKAPEPIVLEPVMPPESRRSKGK